MDGDESRRADRATVPLTIGKCCMQRVKGDGGAPTTTTDIGVVVGGKGAGFGEEGAGSVCTTRGRQG